MKKFLAAISLVCFLILSAMADGNTPGGGRYNDCPDPAVNCHCDTNPDETCPGYGGRAEMVDVNEPSVETGVLGSIPSLTVGVAELVLY